MAFISLIAPTGKGRLMPHREGHGPVLLGFLVFAAFKLSVSLHLPMAFIAPEWRERGWGSTHWSLCRNSGGMWDER